MITFDKLQFIKAEISANGRTEFKYLNKETGNPHYLVVPPGGGSFDFEIPEFEKGVIKLAEKVKNVNTK